MAGQSEDTPVGRDVASELALLTDSQVVSLDGYGERPSDVEPERSKYADGSLLDQVPGNESTGDGLGETPAHPNSSSTGTASRTEPAAVQSATSVWVPRKDGSSPAAGFEPYPDTLVVDRVTQDRVMALRAQQSQVLRAQFGGEMAVVFIDLVGALGASSDEADVARLESDVAFNAVVSPLLREYDGTLIKNVGRSAMACFAELDSATSAAAAIVRAIAQRVKGDGSTTVGLHARVGIDFGSAVVADGDIEGKAVEAAARIHAVAHADDVLVSARAAAQLPTGQLEAVGPIVVEGEAGPLEVFRWIRPSSLQEERSAQQLIATRYRLGGEIGRGPSGVVYQAQDLRLRVPLAVKSLHRYLVPDEAAAERFADQLQTLASLVHPGIVRVLDGWPRSDDAPFFVMDRIDGPDLTLWMARNGQCPPRRAARMVFEVASAVDHAHRRGVVHGNLKPQNIIVTPQNQLVVTDFGMALQTGDGAGPLGSPAFRAPEQLEGRRPDARADVYGLGALLYFLLCGRPPYEGAASLTAVRAVVSGMYRRLETVRSDLPGAFAQIVDRAMAPDRQDRFDGVTELMDALTPWCEATENDCSDVTGNLNSDRPRSFTPPADWTSTEDTQPSFPRPSFRSLSSRAAVALAVTGALMLAGAVGWIVWRGGPPSTGSIAGTPARGEGILELVTNHPARVYVNEQLLGTTPKVRRVWLTEGVHDLTLEANGYPGHREQVDIEAGQTVRRRVTFATPP